MVDLLIFLILIWMGVSFILTGIISYIEISNTKIQEWYYELTPPEEKGLKYYLFCVCYPISLYFLILFGIYFFFFGRGLISSYKRWQHKKRIGLTEKEAIVSRTQRRNSSKSP